MALPRKLLGNTGLEVSQLSLGGTAFAGFFNNFQQVKDPIVLHKALEYGVNYFDVAPWYTNSEELFASVLKKYHRNEYFIGTKVGRYQGIEDPFDFSESKTRQSLDKSLETFGTHIDVIQVHDLEFAVNPEIILQETLPVLNEYKQKGFVKNIGITGYAIEHLLYIITRSEVPVDTILNYCRATLQDSSLLKYTESLKDVGIINASVNSMSLLTDAGPASWHPGHKYTKEVCSKASAYCRSEGVSLPRLSLQHAKSLDFVTTHVMSTFKVEELDDNIKSFMTPLTDHEKQVLQTVQDILRPVKDLHWENNEVAKYWKRRAGIL